MIRSLSWSHPTVERSNVQRCKCEASPVISAVVGVPFSCLPAEYRRIYDNRLRALYSLVKITG